jgi:hypothetical protein
MFQEPLVRPALLVRPVLRGFQAAPDFRAWLAPRVPPDLGWRGLLVLMGKRVRKGLPVLRDFEGRKDLLDRLDQTARTALKETHSLPVLRVLPVQQLKLSQYIKWDTA